MNGSSIRDWNEVYIAIRESYPRIKKRMARKWMWNIDVFWIKTFGSIYKYFMRRGDVLLRKSGDSVITQSAIHWERQWCECYDCHDLQECYECCEAKSWGKSILYYLIPMCQWFRYFREKTKTSITWHDFNNKLIRALKLWDTTGTLRPTPSLF